MCSCSHTCILAGGASFSLRRASRGVETVGAEKRDLDQGLAITPDFKGASSLSFFTKNEIQIYIQKKILLQSRRRFLDQEVTESGVGEKGGRCRGKGCVCCVQGEVGVASEEGGITDIGRKRLDFRGSFGEGKKGFAG